MSLDALIDEVMFQLDLEKEKHIRIDEKLFRPVDLEEIYGDNTKAKNILRWDYNISNKELITHLIEDEKEFIIWEKRMEK